ncbi:sensor histidine kinase [Microbacterium halophytorum]|uniref:sensor histidine kinase n=1 Tax=Microbacterium halophytorum TaxID=2067568 RepID=UPI000CFDE930|nr:ATP-binding protein [Microbacterium halophytorum]
MSDKPSLIDDAWFRVPRIFASSSSGPGHFTRGRFERIVQGLVALSALVLGAQAVVIAVTSGQHAEHPVPVIVTFAALAVMVVACAAGRFARLAAGTFAVAYVAMMVWWALADSEAVDPTQQPWPYYLLTVVVGASVVAFPFGLQVVWAYVPPLAFGIAQLLRAAFAPEAWQVLVWDVSMAILLNLLVVTLGWMFRAISDGVDSARVRAVEAYTQAQAEEAAEQERVEVAMLMHDSVLAALIAAARAESQRERDLAVEMSREALTRLADAGSAAPEGSDEPRTACEIASAIERAAGELGVELDVPAEAPDDAGSSVGVVPGRVARALVLAAKQAIANAVQHADGAGLAARVSAEPAGVRVEISDRGPGLDVEAIPADRIGIRGSIVARMGAIGGAAAVESGPKGTIVRLEWRAVASVHDRGEGGES